MARSEPVFKPPTLTSAAQRKAEDLAERVDAWTLANRMIRDSGEWAGGVDVSDVMELTLFLTRSE